MDHSIRSVTVFCGSSKGRDPEFARQAEELGRLLPAHGYNNLFYGGGNHGLMGRFASAAAEAGAKVTGIITHAFQSVAGYKPSPGEKEIAVKTLQQRKQKLMEKDAFIIMPGGIGSWDELWEVMAHEDVKMWQKSEDLPRPVIVMNVNGYYDPMKMQLDRAAQEGFIYPGRRDLITFVRDAAEAVEKMDQFNLRMCPVAISRVSIPKLVCTR